MNESLDALIKREDTLNPIFQKNAFSREDEGDDALDRITCEELVALIQTLSPRYRMVFNLYAIEGLTHQEISEELGISVGTSKSNLSRARVILQEKIRTMYGSAIVR